jgi:pantoate--beta-alanine ligase
MRTVSEPRELQELCERERVSGRRVGLVPTMGALHRGHATLIEDASRRADVVVVTVFVNPTQFGPNEDFAKYPRTLEADVELAERAGASVVFAPDSSAMYPAGDQTRVRVTEITRDLCGVSRPTHFEGVATVVTKLFALVGRCVACFGRKDFQQLQVIRRLVRDLFLPVDVVGVPTVREGDGLALSSRNRYLSPEARVRARAVPRALDAAVAAFAAGERRTATLLALVDAELRAGADSIDYATLAEVESVRPIEQDRTPDQALLAIAVRLGGARLIDNVVLGEERSPLAGAAQEGAS